MKLKDLKANDYFLVTHLNWVKPFSAICQVVNHQESGMRTLVQGPTGTQFYYPTNIPVIKARLISNLKEETNNASN
ncbi:hypothetical protein FQP85_22035 [Pseudoalteromonas neustonica]|uniref:Uncharacterized protein n=1 Tax=Pseudoalteromonas neustonica TaxID=1840331 RepID=A0ABY3F882_9GAMM|nr:hypothetical protein [Pseudoalteromonas neustonica]TVU79875.1 hypothetical protein FQP85_22035 [Pseudoalteromonas neustonica]